MSRRKADDGMSVNLFPFLSILVAIIGCLTLIIVVLNLSQSNKAEGQAPEEVQRAEEWTLLKEEKEEAEDKFDKMKNLVDNLIQSNSEINDKRTELQRLKEELSSQDEIDKNRNELIAKINTLQAAITAFDKDEPIMNKKIEELLAELERRNLPPEPAKLRVRPSGSGTSRFPYFVEAADNGLLIHKSLSEDPVVVPTAALNQNKEFVELLNLINGRSQSRMIFLVRGTQESLNSYRVAANTIIAYNKENQAQIIPGRLPLPAEGKVDLTPFAQYLRP